MAREARHYALVIGIDDYPGFRPLQGACADAKKVRGWLTDDVRGGGLDPSRVELILSKPDPLAPIQNDIDDALDRLFRASAGQPPPERFYFYFSGHGFGVALDDVALCMAKWSTRFRNAALSSRAYRDLIATSGSYPELLLWFDCCRLSKVRVAGMVPTLAWARDAASSGRIFEAFAAEYQNAAFEATTQPDPDIEPEVRGHFTRALLDALYGAAAQPAGGVLVRDLKSYLEREVPILAQEAGHQQKPVVSNGLLDAASIGAAQPGAVVTIAFSAQRAGTISLEPPVGSDPIRRDDASTGPWQQPLGRGNHRLVEERTGAEKFFRVIATEGRMHVDF